MPHTTWGACASALGVSTDTINRTRKAAGERPKKTDRPWFADDTELFAWWRALRARAGLPGATTPSSPDPAPRRRRDEGEAFNREAMIEELLPELALKRLKRKHERAATDLAKAKAERDRLHADAQEMRTLEEPDDLNATLGVAPRCPQCRRPMGLGESMCWRCQADELRH
jgi:hypothetical protein